MPTTTSTAWNALPAELRLKIYRASWEPRTVAMYLDSSEPSDRFGFTVPHRLETVPLPATLHLCFEARQETLKHYAKYVDRSKPSSPKPRFFNPNLDILHFGISREPPYPYLSINSTIFLPASITVTLGLREQYVSGLRGQRSIPSWVIIWLENSDIMYAIKSIDFWLLDFHDKEGSWNRRYRICRTKMVKKTPIAVFEDAVWRPVRDPEFECQKKGCNQPRELWRWGYSKEESRPRTEKMPHNLQVGISSAAPKPGYNSVLRFPCAVDYWEQLNGREILKQTGAIVFDDGSTWEQEREWSVLRVVNEGVWDRIAYGMAFIYLMIRNPLSNEYDPTEWELYLSYRDWELNRPARREIFTETAHGVCLADYQFDEGRRKGELEDLTLYPVTGMVRSEREYLQKWEQNMNESRNDEAERFFFEEDHDGGHTAKSAIRMTWHQCV
ncbi:hypothetical protein QBC40DRAFT_312928 [Triangularia verruculosa]|uniref:2EXR domain-containing protein n=1 Tax=Triangularia verruculosa TaxID=2587418 RepID=A0AAN6XDM6_9PEZI|nr:hypothetical protein QBC40DRAFT_312928 [Triangularia verruculosa]